MPATRCRPTFLPIGRMFLIEVAHKDGSFFAESPALPRGHHLTDAEGLAALRQQDGAVAIWECEPGAGGMIDVSEDFARKWLGEFEGEREDLPAFIAAHLGDEIDAHFDEQEEARASDVAYIREVSSPEATGRI